MFYLKWLSNSYKQLQVDKQVYESRFGFINARFLILNIT